MSKGLLIAVHTKRQSSASVSLILATPTIGPVKTAANFTYGKSRARSSSPTQRNRSHNKITVMKTTKTENAQMYVVLSAGSFSQVEYFTKPDRSLSL
jgi:hypothetical protein